MYDIIYICASSYINKIRMAAKCATNTSPNLRKALAIQVLCLNKDTDEAGTSQMAENEQAPVAKLDESTTLQDFDVGVTLGTGSFGRVRLATQAVQECVAIKMLKKVEVVRLQQVEHMISEKPY